MIEQSFSVLATLHVLLNNSIAPDILRHLRNCQRESGQAARWRDMYNSVVRPKNLNKRILSETLPRLESSRLVVREKQDDSDAFRITAEGLRAIDEYDRLAADSELQTLPEVAKELLVRHGHPFALEPQKEFLKKHFPLSLNLIILASPSAGKTFMAECCILEELRHGNRVLYVTPYKALNRQKHELFSKIFKEYSIVRSDGDAYASQDQLCQGKLIVATYEKALMALLRDERWLKNISLTVADEITLLNDEERGSNLDLLLTLLKEKSRILTLSSHVGKKDVVAEWLRAKVYEFPANEMNEEFLVKRSNSLVSIENNTGSQEPLVFRNRSAFKVTLDHSSLADDGTLMILVGRRERAESIAEMLAGFRQRRGERLRLPEDSVDEMTPLLARLSSMLERGVAFHHAGLPSEGRSAIEDLLAKRKLNIVVSTPTLSHGVDFPIDHLIVDLDTFGGERLGRIKYLQYRGRASRIGLSKGGNVYVLSESDPNITIDAMRRFLAKPVEPLLPPPLGIEQLEWMMLLACHNSTELGKKTLLNRSKSLISELLACRSSESTVTGEMLDKALSRALKNLAHMKVISVKKNRVLMTETGKRFLPIDWVPRDSNLVLSILRRITKLKSEIEITLVLLMLAVQIGLMRRFDPPRVKLIVWRYLRRLPRDVISRASRSKLLREEALVSLLLEWIDGVPIAQIVSDPVFQAKVQVHDEDLRKLGMYASVEMAKIAALAEDLSYEKVSELAERLSVRLKRGVRDDLVCKDAAIDLFRLDGVGRQRARQLYDNGFKTLLDIYSVIFNEGPKAFEKKANMPRELVKKIIEQAKSIVKKDEHMLALCKSL